MKIYETQFGKMQSRYEKKTNLTLILWTDIEGNFRCFELKGKLSPKTAIDRFLNFIFSGGLKPVQHIQTAILE